MAYARPSTVYSGVNARERYFNSTAENRRNLGVFVLDLQYWICNVSCSWEAVSGRDISNQKQTAQKLQHVLGYILAPLSFLLIGPIKLVTAVDIAIATLSFAITRHPPLLALHCQNDWLIAIHMASSRTIRTMGWLILPGMLLSHLVLALLLVVGSFMLNFIHPHCGGPQSCVGCAAVPTLMYHVAVVSISQTVVSVLWWPELSAGGCFRAAFFCQTYLLLFALLITASNWAVYGRYPHLFGTPLKGLIPVLWLTLLVIMFSALTIVA